MIKALVSNSTHLTVSNGSMSWVSSSPNSGTVRYNTNTQTLEVSGDYGWTQLGTYTTIDLSETTQEVLKWANEKMQQEKQYSTLAAECVSVQAALEQFAKAKEQLDIIVALAQKR